MDQTSELMYWPILRRLDSDFLHSVDKFYVYNFGKSLLVVTRDQRCYSLGDNQHGCLGVGHECKVESEPEEISELAGKAVIQVDSGYQFVVAVTEQGEVWAWGLGQHGLLGDGGATDRHRPVRLALEPVTRVSCGMHNTMALDKKGRLWTWGRHCCVQWAEGRRLQLDQDQLKPTQRKELAGMRIIDFHCALETFLVLTADHMVLIWGNFSQETLLTKPRVVPLLPHMQPVGIRRGIGSFASYTDFWLTLANGQLWMCYYDFEDNFFSCRVEEVEVPISKVISHSNSDIMVLVTKEGNLLVRHEDECVDEAKLQEPIHRLITTSCHSLAEVTGLYDQYSLTLTLTKLLPAALDPERLLALQTFNDPKRANFHFTFPTFGFNDPSRTLYVNREQLCQLSPYYKQLFEKEFKEMVMFHFAYGTYTYFVYFTYLLSLHTGRLEPMVEADWIFELHALASHHATDRIAAQCSEWIEANVPNERLIQLYTFYSQPNYIMYHGFGNLRMLQQTIEKRLTAENCYLFFQWAEKHEGDIILKQFLVDFAKRHVRKVRGRTHRDLLKVRNAMIFDHEQLAALPPPPVSVSGSKKSNSK